MNKKKTIYSFLKTIAAYFFSLNIARKLMLGFIPLVVLLVLISGFALVSLTQLNSLSNSILKTDIVVIATSEKMVDVILAQELYARRYSILKTKDLLKIFWDRDKEFKKLVSTIEEVPEDRQFPISQIASLHNEYTNILLHLLTSTGDSISLSPGEIEKKIKVKQEVIISIIKEMAEKAKQDQREKISMTSSIGTIAFKTSAMFCLFGFFLSVALAMLITRNISGAVKKLKLATEIISKGEFDYSPDIRNKDELGDLSIAFIAMAKRLKQLEKTSLDTSPLTRLPGGVSIEKAMQKRITAGERIAFCLIDIDNFKPYNDYYGYAKGNDVIKETARIIENAVTEFGIVDDFIGHIGGDDFVIITTPELFERICKAVIENFDKIVPEFYDDMVRKRGYLTGENRQGEQVNFPITSLSIAVVTNVKNDIKTYVYFGEVAAEVKEHAKSIAGSVYVVDRRMKNKQKSLPDKNEEKFPQSAGVERRKTYDEPTI